MDLMDEKPFGVDVYGQENSLWFRILLAGEILVWKSIYGRDLYGGILWM